MATARSPPLSSIVDEEPPATEPSPSAGTPASEAAPAAPPAPEIQLEQSTPTHGVKPPKRNL